LAQRRKTLGYSQEQLAEHLGVDRSTVVRWEAGETEPRPWQRRKIADVLDVSPERLEELLTEPDTAADDRLSRASDAEAERDANLRREWQNVGEGAGGAADPSEDSVGGSGDEGGPSRREVLADGSVVAGVELTPRLAHLFMAEPMALDRALGSGSVDEATLVYREQAAAQLVTEYERAGPVTLLAPALEHSYAVWRLIEDCPASISAQRRLCRVASMLATALGIFAYEREWHSREWFGIAVRAAGEAGDERLQAWALAACSLLPYYRGDGRSALGLLDRAAGLIGQSRGVVAAVVAARSARAHALVKDETAMRQALDRARGLLAESSGEERELFGFHEAQLSFYAGSCWLLLDRHRQAEQDSLRALVLYRDTPHYMDPTLVRFDLALTYLRQNELDRVECVGHDALGVRAEHRTGPVVQRGRQLLHAIGRRRSEPVLSELVDRLARL
jgi:transcriptional regulator with XRE-family HTH domain